MTNAAHQVTLIPAGPGTVQAEARAATRHRMRIGMVAPPWFAVPPAGYGGTERVVSYLAEGLVALGHDVTLFAAGGSTTAGHLVETFDHPPSPLLGDPLIEAEHLMEAFARWRDFDVIHDHTRLGLLAAPAVGIPVVHTIHGDLTPSYQAYYQRAYRFGAQFIAISEHQRSTLPAGFDATVIWNGIDLAPWPFRAEAGEYLLFVGRMAPHKGILPAIEIAQRSGRKLVVCAKINEVPEQEYFELVVRPALREVDHEVLVQPPTEQLRSIYAGARATLFPIQWAEPFGLVMIESMATGTPVIAFRNGSAPEVIEDGVTGRVCDNIDEAVAAEAMIGELDRAACRQRVRELFSAPVAVRKHEALYRRLLTAEPQPDTGQWPDRFEEPLST